MGSSFEALVEKPGTNIPEAIGENGVYLLWWERAAPFSEARLSSLGWLTPGNAMAHGNPRLTSHIEGAGVYKISAGVLTQIRSVSTTDREMLRS